MFRYLISKEFWLTILVLILLGLTGFVLFFYVFLPVYTKHNDSVMVPELAKLSVEEAKSALKAMGLEYEVSDSVYLPSLEKLTVVSHEPGALNKVKPGRTIYLTINKATPPLVKFPKIKDVSSYQAKIRLESWGLGVKSMQYEPYEFRQLVMRAELNGEEIKEGDLLPVGTRVVLFVGMGLGHTLQEVPDLVGMPYENAISKILSLGLNIGTILHKPDAEGEPGLVIRQNPAYARGDSINVGGSIDIFISGPEPSETLEGVQDNEIKEN